MTRSEWSGSTRWSRGVMSFGFQRLECRFPLLRIDPGTSHSNRSWMHSFESMVLRKRKESSWQSIRSSNTLIDSKDINLDRFEVRHRPWIRRFLYPNVASNRSIWIRSNWNQTSSIRPASIRTDGFEHLRLRRPLLFDLLHHMNYDQFQVILWWT